MHNLGLELFKKEELINKISYIIHSAAEVSIKKSREDNWKINVTGTKNVLNFATEISRIKVFSHISTAYVVGRRTGVILEDELISHDGFSTLYEESKFEGKN